MGLESGGGRATLMLRYLYMAICLAMGVREACMTCMMRAMRFYVYHYTNSIGQGIQKWYGNIGFFT